MNNLIRFKIHNKSMLINLFPFMLHIDLSDGLHVNIGIVLVTFNFYLSLETGMFD